MAAYRLDADVEGLPRRIANAIRGASYRWLQNEEIVALIDNAGAYPGLEVSDVAPVMPPGGSLYLFNKKECRYFRKDGHPWETKPDFRTVNETHEKLKVDNVKTLNCYYARSAVDDLKRRSYWRLEVPPGRPLIALVHYLRAEGKAGSGQPRGYAYGPRHYQYVDYDSEGDAPPPARRARSWQHAPRGPPLPWPPQPNGFLMPPAREMQPHYQQQQQQQAAVAAFAAAAAALLPGAAPQGPLYQQALPRQHDLGRLAQWMTLQQNGGLPPAGSCRGAPSLGSLGGSGVWDSGGLPLLPGAPALPPAGSSPSLEATGMLATPSQLSHLQQLTSLSLLSQMSSQQLGQMQASAPLPPPPQQQQQQSLSQSPDQNGQLAASLAVLLSQGSHQPPNPPAPAPATLAQLPPASSLGHAGAAPAPSPPGPATAGAVESLTQAAAHRPEQLRALLGQLLATQPAPLPFSTSPALAPSPSTAPVLQSQPAAVVASPPPQVPAAAPAAEQQQQEAVLPQQRQQGAGAPPPVQAPDQVQTARPEAAGAEAAAPQSQQQLAAAVRQLCALAGKEQLANELLAGLAAATGSGMNIAAAGGSPDGAVQSPPEPTPPQQEYKQSLPEQHEQQQQLSQEALELQDNAPLAPGTERQKEQPVMAQSLLQSLSPSLPLEQQQEPDDLAGD